MAAFQHGIWSAESYSIEKKIDENDIVLLVICSIVSDFILIPSLLVIGCICGILVLVSGDGDMWGIGPLNVFIFAASIEGLYISLPSIFFIMYRIICCNYCGNSLLEWYLAKKQEFAKGQFILRGLEIIGCIAIIATYSPSDTSELNVIGNIKQVSFVMFTISAIIIAFFLLSPIIFRCMINNMNINIAQQANVFMFRLQIVQISTV